MSLIGQKKAMNQALNINFHKIFEDISFLY